MTTKKSEWDFNIVETTVIKRREGYLSQHQHCQFKKFFFEAKFKFDTGQVVSFHLTDCREAFGKLDTLDVTYNDELRARKIAFAEYNTILELLQNEQFSHFRVRDGYLAFYKIDSKSPSGVSNIGGVDQSAYSLAVDLKEQVRIMQNR